MDDDRDRREPVRRTGVGGMTVRRMSSVGHCVWSKGCPTAKEDNKNNMSKLKRKRRFVPERDDEKQS